MQPTRKAMRGRKHDAPYVKESQRCRDEAHIAGIVDRRMKYMPHHWDRHSVPWALSGMWE